MDIKLCRRKLKSCERTSLLLEHYYGYTKSDEGKIRHNRKFETLEYYLYTNPKNKAERDHNKINLEMAEKVHAKRILEGQNKKYGFSVEYKVRSNFVDYINELI